jgi:hypothetical protein
MGQTNNICKKNLKNNIFNILHIKLFKSLNRKLLDLTLLTCINITAHIIIFKFKVN